ncbi:trehalose-phosphatase [Roseospira marina]|uniref:trehalose-phosphatase n=1 Tax=Roseospira marina TaxID=140057 RepID=UPI0017993883|nr:trehalose-phosphatase [Roseospira marina]MBB4313319.1 trehalose-phosphatase [Roseospira marina]MBB5085940.1 trehalose-phosphatase [Roseospira marina]
MTTEPRLRPVRDLPHALEAFDALDAALNGREPAIFLDYDGTLTPIVSRPEDAILSDEGRAVVDTLARKRPVAVVSGRDRPDVEKLVGIDSLTFAGSHGFDIRTPAAGVLTLEGIGDYTALMDEVESRLKAGLSEIPGALVERKKFSVAAHYRLVPDLDYPLFRSVLDRVLGAVHGLKEKPGKKVFEIQPAIDWDKGKAVQHLLGTLSLDDPEHAPMFFGDDVTDEDAFKALQGMNGIGVLAAPASDSDQGRVSAADFRVDDPDQVLDLLRRLTP